MRGCLGRYKFGGRLVICEKLSLADERLKLKSPQGETLYFKNKLSFFTCD